MDVVVSVVMIVHNREKLVANMIEDVLGQSYTDFEFVIVDNCSVDSSGHIVDEYEKKDQRIVVSHLPEDIYIGAARNRGLDLANGEYVAFVDDDDHICDKYLEYLIMLTENGYYDISLCNSVEINGGVTKPFVEIEKDEVISCKEAVLELLMRRKIRAPLPSKLIRRYLYNRYRFKENTLHDDVHVIYKYLSDANGVSIGKEQYYAHVRHDLNLSGFIDESKRFTKDVIQEYYDAYIARKSFLERRFPDMQDYLVYNVGSFMISMCDKIISYHITGCDDLYKKMSKYLFDSYNFSIINKYASKEEILKINKIQK